MDRRRRVSKLLPLTLMGAMLLATQAYGQDPRPVREYERWGLFGVGKLRTMANNLNNVADGQLRWPQWAHLPAMEYPYNPDSEGRHVMYAVGFSFHVGGYSLDYGPTFDEAQSDGGYTTPRVESADRANYRYYDGYHYEGHAGYVNSDENNGLALSDNPDSWPSQWPATLPSHDFYHDRDHPDYQNAYQIGQATAAALPVDSVVGFPGIGANGQVMADQEFIAVNFSRNRENVGDPDGPEGKLMLYTVMRGLSYSGDFYDDFLIFQWEVTNIGTEPITETYLGIKYDPDFPYATYQDYHSYSRTDCFAFDDEYQMAYGWDGDGDVPGATYGNWDHPIPAKLTDETIVSPAMTGTMFLKTPKADDGSGEVGVGTFDAYYIRTKNSVYGVGSGMKKFYNNNIANREPDASDPTAGWDPDDTNHDGIDDWTWDNPYPVGPNEIVYSSGYAGEYTLNAGPITLDVGETDTLIVAVIMGDTRDALFKNARFAQQLYENDWVPIRPPVEPRLRTYESTGAVKLVWDTRSEDDSLNASSNRTLFEGYKLYRSIDGGVTWEGNVITDENGTVVDNVPLGQWDLANNVTGRSQYLPTFNMGTDSGFEEILEIVENDTTILEMDGADTLFYGEFTAGDTTGRYVYVDENVIDGFTYTYALVAYSADDIATELPPVQSSRTSGSHIQRATPHAPAASSAQELSEVRVVPNPYKVVAAWENSQTERKIKFTHVPRECTIRIYNVAGELMQTLHHDANDPIESEVIWNLRSSENREVAPGLYLYYLESSYGDTKGKFAIIK